MNYFITSSLVSFEMRSDFSFTNSFNCLENQVFNVIKI